MQRQEIIEEINKLTKIELNQSDFIGKGSNAEVYKYKLKNYELALKCFKDDNQQGAQAESKILNEINNSMLNCPGIIEYYGMKQLEISESGSINSKYNRYVMFFQLGEVDFDKIINKLDLSIEEAFTFLSQIFLPLICLHSRGCFHRDLKPANILVAMKDAKPFQYFLTDFGEGKLMEVKNQKNDTSITIRGTADYLSPELWKFYKNQLDFGKYIPQKADIYSLGIVMLQLLLGKSKQNLIKNLSVSRDSEQQFNNELKNLKNELLKIQEFEKNQQLLSAILSMVSYKAEDRKSIFEICSNVITANLFNINAIQPINLNSMIQQLILLLNQSNTNQIIYKESPSPSKICEFCNKKIETNKFDQHLVENREEHFEIMKNIQLAIVKAKQQTFDNSILYKQVKISIHPHKLYFAGVQQDHWFCDAVTDSPEEICLCGHQEKEYNYHKNEGSLRFSCKECNNTYCIKCVQKFKQ